MSDSRDTFSRIYREQIWGAGSGGGSDCEVSRPFCDAASALIAEKSIRTVVDIGCGDCHAITHLVLGDAAYIGVDVVSWEDIMSSLPLEHRVPKPDNFFCLDALVDDLPSGDLALVKEITQHISDMDVFQLLEVQLRKYRYVLHCSVATDVNEPCGGRGGTRPVNLSLPPFSQNTAEVGRYRHVDTEYRIELWRPDEQSIW